MNSPKNTPENCQGFALVIALSLMAFVLLLLLSITTLVQVETQSAQISARSICIQKNIYDEKNHPKSNRDFVVLCLCSG